MNEFEPASALYLINAPTATVISRAEMKKHLRVDAANTADDDTIDAYTDAIVQHLDGRDGILGRALCDQTWELRLSTFPCRAIDIPLPPLIEIVSVKYRGPDGIETLLADNAYHVVGSGGRGQVRLRAGASWPIVSCDWPEPVIVQFRCGYIDSGASPPAVNVPKPVVAAIKMMTANLYENRETIAIGQTAIELPWAARALLAPYIVYGS